MATTSTASEYDEWKLLRFNPRRAARGAWAAELQHGTDGTAWFNVAAIHKTIRDYGDHPELQLALECYRTRREYP